MYCPDCGEEIDESAEYCIHCGTAITAEPDSTDASSQSEGATETSEPTADANRSATDANESPTATTESATETTSWPITRKLAGVAGAVSLGALLLPWYTEASAEVAGQSVSAGSFSANALAIEISPLVLAATGGAILFMLLAWGRGWGWLTMLLSAIGGGAMVYIDLAAISIVGSTYTIGTVTVNGQQIPAAALEPGIGLFAHAIAGAGFVLFGLAGIVGSFLTG